MKSEQSLLLRFIWSVIIAISFFYLINEAQGCEFATDITKTDRGTWEISNDCYLEFGRALQAERLQKEQLKLQKDQIENYKALLDLSKQELSLHKDRATFWQDTAFRLDRRVAQLEKASQYERYFWVGVGVLAGWALTK